VIPGTGTVDRLVDGFGTTTTGLGTKSTSRSERTDDTGRVDEEGTLDEEASIPDEETGPERISLICVGRRGKYDQMAFNRDVLILSCFHSTEY
jgi:hypothetical protein